MKGLFLAGLLLLTSCEVCVTGRMCLDSENVPPAQAGEGYRDSVACALACGEGYQDSQQAAEDADIFIPPGEHPLDDENLGLWLRGDFTDSLVLRALHGQGLYEDYHLVGGMASKGSNAPWLCKACGQWNHAHNSRCSKCGGGK